MKKVRVSNKKEVIVIITVSRTPQRTNQGMQISISQCNQMRGEMMPATKHRNFRSYFRIR